jgi:transposase-like protein
MDGQKMTLDIRGSLKNTKIRSNKYVVIEELISNSIDSFLIRRHQDPSDMNLRIAVSIDLFATDLLEDQLDLSISCTDNGCGLGEEQTDAFLTKDTSYKDDLAIAGIGQCKGSGRIQFFHHFRRVGMRSTYRSDGHVLTRTLSLEARKKINFGDFGVSDGDPAEIGTTITLANLKPGPREHFYGHSSESLKQTFSAANVRRHVLIAFLQRLVSLRTELGGFEISFQTNYPGKKDDKNKDDKTSLLAADLPTVSNFRDTQVEERDPKTGGPLGKYEKFRLSHYKLDAALYDLPRNAISLCAKSSPVKDITARYLRTRTAQNNPVGGYHHIVLIEGDLLDRRVNEQRDGFDGIPEENPAQGLFSDEMVSYEAIYEKIDPIIDELVAPAGWSKDAVLKDVADKFGISSQMLTDTDTRVRHGDNAQSIAERVLKKYQDRIIADTAKIFDLKEEIAKTEPHSADFRAKIHELSWRYASSLKAFDMANLSQLVVRRAVIVEVLSLACDRKLDLQTTDERRKDESLIHSIFFPMRRDSREVSDHDIWLLSEEYQYYDYIVSDKLLSQIEWAGDMKLFEKDIDEEFEEILRRRADVNGAKRPDIAIFSKEGSAIIVEFKAPGVSMDDHIGDLSEYAHLLAAKSNGRLKKFYGYLIGNTINHMRMAGWTRFAQGKGYFRSSDLRDPENGRVLGGLYEETLFFEDIVDRARKRISVYKDRLQVDLTRS